MLVACAMGQEEFQELSSFLRRFIRRLKWLRGVEGLCATAIAALVLFAMGPGVDRLKDHFPYAPLAYSILTGLVLLAVIGWSLFRLLGRFSQERAALYIEQKEPKLRNNLINSLQLYPQVVEGGNAPGFSASMVLALLRTTKKQIAALRVDDLLDTQRVKSHLRLLGFLLAPVGAMVLLNPSWVGGTIDLLTRPLDHLPPSKTEIDIEPKGLRVARGSPVTIQARAWGAMPSSLEIVTWTGVSERGELLGEEKAPMENLGGGQFSAKIPRLEKTLRYRAVTGPFASPVYTAEAVDPPEIANVQLILYPPAYTGLASVTVPEGNLDGLKGSSIRLDAVATKEVVKAEIVTDDGKKIPLKIDGRKLQANFVLFQSQSYRIVVEDAYGFRNSPITYTLIAKPDGFPTVDLLRPTEDLEVNGDEMLTLEYSARDDFGIGEIALVTKVGEREDKIILQRDEAKRVVLRDQYKWDLSRLGLRDGEEAILVLQVFDNDTISGPKIGTSRSVRLKLKDLKGEHQQLAEMVRDLNQRMVDLLGDHLETPLPDDKASAPAKALEQRFEQNLAEALKRTEEILRRTERDRMSDFATWSDLDALRRNLEFTKNELLAKQAQATTAEEKIKSRDEIATELERMALLSEDVSKRLKAQQLAAAAQDLARSQERLMDALEKLQAGDKNLDSIMKQIADLAKTLASLQQALSQMAQLPDEFMNAENMQGLGFDDMMRALEEIRKKLLAGDLEGARQLARELFNQMAQMVAALQSARRAAMNSGMGRMQGEMQRQTNELQEIAREQQEILVQTEGLNNAARTERDAALKKKLDEFLDRAIGELGRLTELFPDREGPDDPSLLTNLDDATMNALLKNLIAKLSNKDFDGFHEGDGLARKELAKKRTLVQEPRARRAEKSLDGIKSELEALRKEPPRALTDAEKRELRDLAHRQDVLRDRTQSLHEKLEALFQIFPQLDPKIVQNIGE
ncbi:MAG TPA: DUF4175 family protein, partial [Candidatus Binatia bacterium]|nr:DUF4175 family protein [Candidatus Binatia bacterium]